MAAGMYTKDKDITDLDMTGNASLQRMVNAQTKDGITALHDTSDRGKLDQVKLLVEVLKANVNTVSHNGVTPLMNACACHFWCYISTSCSLLADSCHMPCLALSKPWIP